MNVAEKLQILAEAARYDVSCSSSGCARSAQAKGLGASSQAGVCHSWSDDGRCVSLLKILFSNHCIYNCAFCVNRRDNDIPRASFTVEEVVDLTINFYRRNYIEGLFLSSGVLRSPDYTMARLCEIVSRLRHRHQFFGYIHLKLIPSASPELMQRALACADRVSLNIELPSEQSLRLLAPEKPRQGIIQPMLTTGKALMENRAERKKNCKTPPLAPAGQSTQMIVGASPESDRQILNLSSRLYQRASLKRVYYSAYIPIMHSQNLPTLSAPPLLREHRLYQADWLMRYYNFEVDEITDDQNPFLDEHLDPKAAWAIRHPQFFPCDINRADYHELLRVPGIGPVSARRIVSSRRHGPLRFEHLAKIGVVVKRARHFIICQGRFHGCGPEAAWKVRTDLMGKEQTGRDHAQQLELRLA